MMSAAPLASPLAPSIRLSALQAPATMNHVNGRANQAYGIRASTSGTSTRGMTPSQKMLARTAAPTAASIRYRGRTRRVTSSHRPASTTGKAAMASGSDPESAAEPACGATISATRQAATTIVPPRREVGKRCSFRAPSASSTPTERARIPIGIRMPAQAAATATGHQSIKSAAPVWLTPILLFVVVRAARFGVRFRPVIRQFSVESRKDQDKWQISRKRIPVA